MLWSLLFAIGVAQGCFLIALFSIRKNANRLAARLLQGLLFLAVVSNLDDLLLSTGWYKTAPWLFGWSFGALFAYGPVIYLYVQSKTFAKLRPGQWLHFLPALLVTALYLPFLTATPAAKIDLIERYLDGRSAVQSFGVVLLTLQLIHLALYVRALRGAPAHPRGVVRLPAFLGLLTLAVALLGAVNLYSGVYAPEATYFFTIFSTGLTYYIAYKLALDPDGLTPSLPKKQPGIPRNESEEAALMAQLEYAMTERKRFADPDLNLPGLAAELGIPPHRLSSLINQKFGITFSEYISRMRVEEFLAKMKDARFAHLSLHGLALEVGFNSKSAFNAAFKKVTGKNPSDFKRA